MKIKILPALQIFFAILFAPVQSLWADTVSDSFKCTQELPEGQWGGKLSSVQRAYQGLNSFNGEFEQDSYLAALDLSELSSGSVWFGGRGKMRWHYSLPEEQTFIIKEQTMWLYQPVDRQIILEDFSQFVLSDLPLAFLMGLGDLSKDFTVKSLCKAGTNLLFGMAPRKSDEPAREEGIQQFKLLVSSSNYLPLGAQVQDLSGNINSVRFLKPKFNGSIDAKLFEFEYPDGVDVSDQRGD